MGDDTDRDESQRDIENLIKRLRERAEQEQEKTRSGWALIGGSALFMGRANALNEAADLLEEKMVE